MFGLVWKVLATVAAIAGAALAQRALTAGWRAATGHEPPEMPESPETGLGEAIAYAAVAGAVLNTARVLATRQAAHYYSKRAGGTLPKALTGKD